MNPITRKQHEATLVKLSEQLHAALRQHDGRSRLLGAEPQA